jgi:type IX secretion system PorP/SprF family membrane protein
MSVFQANFTDLDLTSEVFNVEDVNFSYNPSKVLLANFGVGAFYDTEDFFVGVSTPRFLKNRLEGKNPDLTIYNSSRGKSEPTYYLMGGYNLKLNAAMEFQPSMLTRATIGAPLSVGFYGTMILKKSLKLGAFYNFKEVVGGMVYFHVNKKTEIGYSFDVAANELIRTNFGSHEVTMTYNFRKINRKIVYPRRF